jgi:hypothetical protein
VFFVIGIILFCAFISLLILDDYDDYFFITVICLILSITSCAVGAGTNIDIKHNCKHQCQHKKSTSTTIKITNYYINEDDNVVIDNTVYAVNFNLYKLIVNEKTNITLNMEYTNIGKSDNFKIIDKPDKTEVKSDDSEWWNTIE